MSTYEYRCDTCNKLVDLQFPFGQAPQTAPCPTCNNQARKFFGKTSVIFRGGGWAGKSSIS
jgi:putative FmdB family regulatory protein